MLLHLEPSVLQDLRPKLGILRSSRSYDVPVEGQHLELSAALREVSVCVARFRGRSTTWSRSGASLRSRVRPCRAPRRSTRSEASAGSRVGRLTCFCSPVSLLGLISRALASSLALGCCSSTKNIRFEQISPRGKSSRSSVDERETGFLRSIKTAVRLLRLHTHHLESPHL